MTRVLLAIVLTACSFEHGTLNPLPADASPGDRPGDGQRLDAGPDAPPDAFACTSHGQCSSMMSGTCCVNPGPSGHCATGTVIATVCVPP